MAWSYISHVLNFCKIVDSFLYKPRQAKWNPYNASVHFVEWVSKPFELDDIEKLQTKNYKVLSCVLN